MFQNLGDQLGDHFKAERFSDDNIDPVLSHLIPMKLHAPSRYHGDRDLRIHFLQDLTHLPARKFWHPEVRKDEIELIGSKSFNALFPVGGYDHPVPLGPEHLTEDILDRGTVLDHKDPGGWNFFD